MDGFELMNFNTPGSRMRPGRIDLNQMGMMPNPGLDLNFTNYQPGSPSSAMTGTGFDSMGASTAPEGGGIFDGMLGKDGWGNLALGGIQAGIQGYTGLKQLGVAKDQLDFQKKAFNKNYSAQRQRTNTQLRDRQRRRYSENPGYYQSPDEYMAQNGVK
jgi:hypothetical protein